MKTRITTTTAALPFGPERTRRLLRFDGGALAGRRLAVFLSASGTIGLAWADRPYTDWSTPITLASGIAGNGFGAAINGIDTLLLAYSESGTNDLKSIRAVWDGSAWQLSPAVTVYTGDVNSDPSVTIDPFGTAWVSWSRLASGVRRIQVKSSDNLGDTWGSGPADAGDEVHVGGLTAVASLACAPGSVYIVYYFDSQLLCARRKILPDGDWSDPSVIASGSETSPQFSCAARSDGLLNVAYGVSQLLYREFDGLNLGPAAILNPSPAGSVQCGWNSQNPLVVFTEPSGDSQYRIKVAERSTGEFAAPKLLDTRNDVFEYLIAYNAAAGSFTDLTAPAQSYDAGDMYHPASGFLLQHYGDALYFGMDLPFRYLHLFLSQPGTGGTVGYSYWNGTQWITFTPFGGAITLDQAEVAIRLWDDYDSIPPDWQRVVVDGHSAFWIRANVLDAFTTPPIGSMAAAIGNVTAVCMGRS